MSNQSFCRGPLPPSSPNHFHRWISLQQLHWLWKAIAWSSRPQSFPFSLKLITDETLPVFLAIFFANIFCKYLGQYFWGSSPMRSSRYFPTGHKKFENPGWTKTHTDWSKFSCSFSVSIIGVVQKSCWHQTIVINFLHKIRSLTVKFLLEFF